MLGKAAFALSLILTSFAITASLASNAQQLEKVWRIGLLSNNKGGVVVPASFWDAMRKFGWVEGENVRIEPHYVDDGDQLTMLAKELAKSNVDLIMTVGTLASEAAARATKTVPIVFSQGNDPVESGLVASLSRPGGNITGFTQGAYDDKLLQILRDAVPGISSIAVPMLQYVEPSTLLAAQALGLRIRGVKIQSWDDWDTFFAGAERAGASAVLIFDFPGFGRNSERVRRIAAGAVKHRFPGIAPYREFAVAGGLLSYGPAPEQKWPRMAAQIDKIFHGATPGNVPVEQPSKFELVINVKTAKALGLTLQQSLLLRADELIQ